ncbi:hypothetical protein MASR2M17_24010 [Aminivibrio sp.]
MRWLALLCLTASLLCLAPAEGTAAVPGGHIRGVVLTMDGRGYVGLPMNIWDGKVVRRAVTDINGNFVVSGMVPGSVFAVRWKGKRAADLRIDGLRFPMEGDLFLSLELASTGEGKTYTVRIPSNPSTGYGWTILSSGRPTGARLTQIPWSPHRSTGRDDRPGIELWTFEGERKGIANVIMGYQRPWEKGKSPAAYHILSLMVR